METYEISPEILREEPHGRVYAGPTNTRVLVKKVPFAPGFPQGIYCSLSREVEYPQSVYVIRRDRMLNRVEDGRFVYYSFFEYLDTDLAAFIAASAAPLTSALVKKLLFQLLKGVGHCHDCIIIHRNLNPKTLLLDRNGENLKIGDAVGCSFTFVGQTSHPGKVTRYYQAPEVLLGSDDYSTPADIWTVGCIFGEMVTKDVLFVGYGGNDDPVEADRQQLYEIFRKCLHLIQIKESQLKQR